MTKKEVLTQFCKLSAQVASHHCRNMEAADCLCGEKDPTISEFQFSPKVMEFITEAVTEKINAGLTMFTVKVVIGKGGVFAFNGIQARDIADALALYTPKLQPDERIASIEETPK